MGIMLGPGVGLGASGVTGTIADDQQVTIAWDGANGFGTDGPTIELYDDFRNGVDGVAHVLTDPIIGDWDARPGTPLVDDAQSLNKGKSLAIIQDNTSAQIQFAFTAGVTEFFLCAWRRCTIGDKYHYSGQLKENWILDQSGSFGGDDEYDLIFPNSNGSGSGGWGMAGNDGSRIGKWTEDTDRNIWHRYVVWEKSNDPADMDFYLQRLTPDSVHDSTNTPDELTMFTNLFPNSTTVGRINFPGFSNIGRYKAVGFVTKTNPAIIYHHQNGGVGVNGPYLGEQFVAGDFVGMTELNGNTYTAGAKVDSKGRSIQNITQANPGVVSSSGHSFLNGDVLEIRNVVGMTEVNDTYYVIANVVAGTSYELNDVDGNNIDTSGFTAYSSGGQGDRYTSYPLTDCDATLFTTFIRSGDPELVRSNEMYWLDCVYVASGAGAAARVEIGDDAVYANCTRLDIATIDSYADQSITCTLRKQSLASFDGAYIHITKADNTQVGTSRLIS